MKNLLIGIVLASLLSACGFKHMRPYAEWEEKHFVGVDLPKSKDILKTDNIIKDFRFQKEFADVWQASLSLAVQGAGVLRLSQENNGHGSILFVASTPRSFLPDYAHKFGGQVQLELIESWLVVNVVSEDVDTTRVTLAWIDPETGGLHKIRSSARDDFVLERRDIAEFAAQNFQVALNEQLNMDKTAARLSGLPEGPVETGGPTSAPPSGANWARYAEGYGNYVSGIARSQMYILENRDLTKKLDAIAQRILNAAGALNLKVKIFVFSGSGGQTAFSLGNGDIFINSSLLGEPNDIHHVASILAHEIDHILNQDHIVRAEQEFKDLNRKMNILVGSTAVAFVAVIAANPDIWFETEDSSADALERLGGTAIIFGAMAASAIVGTEYGEITLSDFSIEQEIRADRNAAIYLWRAGFEPRALLEVLRQFYQR